MADPQEYPQTLEDWIKINDLGDNYQWYYDNYTWLKDNFFTLPLSLDYLQKWYELDLNKRGFDPDKSDPNHLIRNNYGQLMDYFLGSFPLTEYNANNLDPSVGLPLTGNSTIDAVLSSTATSLNIPISKVAEGKEDTRIIAKDPVTGFVDAIPQGFKNAMTQIDNTLGLSGGIKSLTGGIKDLAGGAKMAFYAVIIILVIIIALEIIKTLRDL
jgi:hypothetical protein